MSTLLTQVQSLNVYSRGDRRAPHKPLLLLLAIGRLLQGQRALPFADVEESLRPLLCTFAPPVKARHQPELPYWHLQADGLWTVSSEQPLPRQRGGFPRMAGLRDSSGQLPEAVADALLQQPQLRDDVVQALLDKHFPPSIHEDLLSAVGLFAPQRRADQAPGTRRRDPAFRRDVLRAYEHRCAVSGFRAALGGSYLGVEAAHVRWHAHNGPDTVSNGLALEPTLHRLFDLGVWTLTDDHRILVSAELTGTDETTSRLRGLSGRALRAPLPGHPPIDPAFIRWHREASQGGIFRQPALGM